LAYEARPHFDIHGALYIWLVFAEFSQHTFSRKNQTLDAREQKGIAMAGNAGARLYFLGTLPVFVV